MSDSMHRCGLPSGYQPWWLSMAGNLGGVYPFYDAESPSTAMSLDIGNVIQARQDRGAKVQLDTVGLVAKAMSPWGHARLYIEARERLGD